MKSEAKAMRKLVILGSVSLVFLAGCGGGTSQSVNNQSPSPPTITTISPNSAAAGGAAFTLTISGTNFVTASMVNFGGTARTTTLVSATQLTAAIPAAAIAQAGTAAVTVTNPAPGGGTSNTVNFTITSGTNPIPTITGLSPSVTAVGGPAFTLTVAGSNFVASSVVRWNGSDRPTAFVNNGQVTAQIPVGDIAATGTAAITVFNPAPGGGSSNSFTFSIVTGVGPVSVAVAADPSGKFGKFAYVANSTSNNVSMYTINATTGALTSIGSPVAADFCANSVTVDPFGKFAYVANWGCGDTAGNVSMYTINPTTGALTSIGTIDAGIAPFSVAVDPSGKSAYVANEGGSSPTSVSMYTINATTGALTSIGMIAAGGRAISVTVDPTGKFAYVTNSGSNDVSMYTINASTGTLTSIGTIAAGFSPTSIAIDPSGKFAYVTNCGDLLAVSGDVSMYTINPSTGTLSSTGTIGAGGCPRSLAVDPSGKFGYVVDSGNLNDSGAGVSMYTINASTGTLTSIGTIAAGLSPTSIAIDPSGKFAYVTNSGSNDVSMYTINATTGALTLIGTIGT